MRQHLLGFIVFCTAHLADAHVFAADSLVCGAPSEVGQVGGVGFAGPWIADNAEAAVFVPQAASLIGPVGLATQGGSLFYDGVLLQSGQPLATHSGARIYRPLDTSPSSLAAALGWIEAHTTFFGDQQSGFGVPGSSVWIGLLLNGGSAGNGIGGLQYLAQVHLYDGMNIAHLSQDDNNKDGEVVAIGRGNSNFQWNVERTCAHSPCGGTTSSLGFLSSVAMNNQTHWVVLKFDFQSAATTAMTFWLDPTPSAIDPLTSTALTLTGNSQSAKTVTLPALHFNWIEFGGQSSTFALDELRITDSFADLSNGASAIGCDAVFTNGFE